MKRINVLIACIVVATTMAAAFHWQRTRVNLVAQESANGAKADSRNREHQRVQEQPKSSEERKYPIFFVEDLIEILTEHAEKFLDQKIAKNSSDLRRELDRTEFSVKPSAANPNELSTEELYRRTGESLFLVAGLTRPKEGETSWQTAFSTAFVVHEDGILSTSAHVFDHDEDDDAVVVMDALGHVYPVIEVLAANRKADTSLFRIGKNGLKPLPMGNDPLPGSPIRVMGHPGDSFFYFSAGHVANFEKDDDGQIWMNVTADFGQGSSGGPVMDAAGNVVAQVSRTYTLYAGGETSNRQQRNRFARQSAAEKNEEPKDAKEEKPSSKRRADPQMVFKACTPVSAIRSLMK